MNPNTSSAEDPVAFAASWLAVEKNPPRPIVPYLRQTFGLDAKQACQAIAEANLRKARAI